MKKTIVKYIARFETVSRYIMYFLLIVALILLVMNVAHIAWSFLFT